MARTLLTGGTVLVHNDRDEVETVRADVLVNNGIIEKVARDIRVDGPCERIDCANKIIAPGFVNTHQHVWQTQLKGLHADQTLLEYLPCGNFTSSLYEPDDVYWGQLAGMLETLNGGITTTLDYSHITYSPEHVFAAIQATAAAGMRSVHAFTPTPRAKFDANGQMEMLPLLEPWIMETFDKLATTELGRCITLGFAFDGLYLPKEMLQPLFKQVYDANVRVLTTHDNSWAFNGNKPSAFAKLRDDQLLDPRHEARWVFVHPTNLQEQPITEIRQHGAFISITPASELSMGMGTPVPIALCREHDEIASQVTVGIDCHSIAEAFLPGQLRSQLFAARQHTHATANAKGQWYASMDPRMGHFAGVREAFNLATINGAHALGMENEIGRVKPGYRADLVIWEKNSPSMLAAAEQDPVAAIIIHSSPADVYGVLVDGVVIKLNGKLLPTQGAPAQSGSLLAAYNRPHQDPVAWDAIANHVLKSRERIMHEVGKIDLPTSCAKLVDAFYLNKSGLLDPVK